jgi:hypothetical protein
MKGLRKGVQGVGRARLRPGPRMQAGKLGLFRWTALLGLNACRLVRRSLPLRKSRTDHVPAKSEPWFARVSARHMNWPNNISRTSVPVAPIESSIFREPRRTELFPLTLVPDSPLLTHNLGLQRLYLFLVGGLTEDCRAERNILGAPEPIQAYPSSKEYASDHPELLPIATCENIQPDHYLRAAVPKIPGPDSSQPIRKNTGDHQHGDRSERELLHGPLSVILKNWLETKLPIRRALTKKVSPAMYDLAIHRNSRGCERRDLVVLRRWTESN